MCRSSVPNGFGARYGHLFLVYAYQTGTFEVLCAAFCGVGHPEMRGIVVVEDESDYQAWLQQQQTFAQLRLTPKKFI